MKIDRQQQHAEGKHPEPKDRQKSQEAADNEGNTQRDTQGTRSGHFDREPPDADSVRMPPMVVGIGLVQRIAGSRASI